MTKAPQDISNSKYFLYIAIAFVTLLLISNTVAVKLIAIGPFVLAGATFIFPVTYIFGDILTEVYGYQAARKIIWSGFGALIIMSLAYLFIQILPAASFWPGQEAYSQILGFAPRIVLGSIVAFFVGEFCNSYILSKMKIWSQGKHLWMRTIGSTVVGEGIDSFVFVLIAFYGTIPIAALFTVIYSSYLFKVGIEVLATPVTYFVVNKLKKIEEVDVYDMNINYNPFHLSGKN